MAGNPVMFWDPDGNAGWDPDKWDRLNDLSRRLYGKDFSLLDRPDARKVLEAMSTAMDFIPFVSEIKGVIECLAEGDIACAVAEAMPGPSSRKVSKASEPVEDAVSSAVTKKPGEMAGKRLGHTFTKHGAKNTDHLLKEAKGSGRPVGQWLDNDAAEQFIAERLDDLKNGAKTFDLPPGLGRIIHPDGTFTVATKARLVPSGSGVKTAYPSLE